MPWREKTVEQNRKSFVEEALAQELSFSELCRRYAITRRTGYKWLDRYLNGEDLSNRSRRPFHTPNKTCEEMEEKLLETRAAHPAWGPRKLKRYLEKKAVVGLPATSTIGDILKRNNCIDPVESLKHKAHKRFERETPNDLWQADFKGDFAMNNRQRCYPLTVLDDHSRYSLAIDARSNQKLPCVVETFTRLFNEYGMPNTILTDNGNPWGNSQVTGYTQFEVWLMNLDICPIHGRILHPQTQGKEERLHRTLKAELLAYTPINNLEHAQYEFDAWRKMYNEERPHEALDLDVPAEHYRASDRRMPQRIADYDYPSDWKIRKINRNGHFSFRSHRYFLSEAIAENHIAFRESENTGLIDLRYRGFRIGMLDPDEHCIINKRIFRWKSTDD